MNKRITLTMKEIKRLKVMSMLEEQLMTRAEAAQKLNLSERQVYRIQKSYREKGEQGLVHGNRGKPSQRSISKEVCTQITTLLKSSVLNASLAATATGPFFLSQCAYDLVLNKLTAINMAMAGTIVFVSCIITRFLI